MNGRSFREAVEVDESRDHLLARPRFAGDEDRRLRGGDLGRGVQEPGHGGGAPDQVPPVEAVAQTLLQEAVLLLQAAVLHRPLQGQAEFVEIERLRQVVVGPLLERLHGRLHGGVGRHDDDGDRRVEGLDLGQRLEARNLDHPDVHQDQVERPALHRRDGAPAVVRLRDRIAPARQERPEHRPVGKVVIRHENGMFCLHEWITLSFPFYRQEDGRPSCLCPVRSPAGLRRRGPRRSCGRSRARVPFPTAGS